jgi:hypothetical protein
LASEPSLPVSVFSKPIISAGDRLPDFAPSIAKILTYPALAPAPRPQRLQPLGQWLTLYSLAKANSTSHLGLIPLDGLPSSGKNVKKI